jgi:hypothetical protein
MATTTTVILSCDRCESEKGLKRYEVLSEGSKTVVDLCGQHRSALDQVLAYGKTGRVKRSVGR